MKVQHFKYPPGAVDKTASDGEEMMRKWLSVLVALVLLPEGRGFLPAPPATRLLLRGSANGTPGRVRRESRCSASLRAILDKIPLPQSPRPSEIMKRLENKEVRRRACARVRASARVCWRLRVRIPGVFGAGSP